MSIIFVDTTTGEILENVRIIETEPKQNKSGVRGRMVTITCAANGCSNTKQVRAADVARGWGKYCSKSCTKK